MIDREQHRFGFSRFGNIRDVKKGGLLKKTGPRLGFLDGRPVHLNSTSPKVTFAGAGSGKGRDFLIYNACQFAGSAVYNDPKGEIAAISIHNQINLGKSGYCVNPLGLANLPQHALNPWCSLDPQSPTFHADVKLHIASVIELSGSASSEFFEVRARDWCEALLKWQRMTYGPVDPPQFFRLLNTIEANPKEWERISRDMQQSDLEEVRRVSAELSWKREHARGESSGIWGSIFKSWGWLADPQIAASLTNPDFSPDVICNAAQPCTVYVNTPAEYQLASYKRMVFTAFALAKLRHVGSPPVQFNLDEAGNLGRFDLMLLLYAYGRGPGIVVHGIFQDIGQPVRNFSPAALQGILGSSQLRQFFGVRDLETASLVSGLLGAETLEYADTLQQMRDAHQAQAAALGLLDGADPLLAGLQAGYYERASRHRTKQHRLLRTPAEVMNTPESRQYLFISGLDVPPLYAEKYPYWTQRDMAGAFLANPYHPPVDRVTIATRLGKRTRRVITERVPDSLAHWPQYKNGLWSYVKGYRPKAGRAGGKAGGFWVPAMSGPEEKTLRLPHGEFLYLPDE